MNRHGTIHFLRALWHPLDSRWKDYDMRKGFTRKPQTDEPATRGKNYITPSGLQRDSAVRGSTGFCSPQGTPGEKTTKVVWRRARRNAAIAW